MKMKILTIPLMSPTMPKMECLLQKIGFGACLFNFLKLFFQYIPTAQLTFGEFELQLELGLISNEVGPKNSKKVGNVWSKNIEKR